MANKKGSTFNTKHRTTDERCSDRNERINALNIAMWFSASHVTLTSSIFVVIVIYHQHRRFVLAWQMLMRIDFVFFLFTSAIFALIVLN